jgi:hypothetical protein
VGSGGALPAEGEGIVTMLVESGSGRYVHMALRIMFSGRDATISRHSDTF